MSWPCGGRCLSVDLSKNGIAEEGAAALCQALQSNNVLQTLTLDTNSIGDAGVSPLAQYLSSESLYISCIASCRLPAESLLSTRGRAPCTTPAIVHVSMLAAVRISGCSKPHITHMSGQIQASRNPGSFRAGSCASCNRLAAVTASHGA